MSTHNISFSIQRTENSALIILNLPLWDFSKGLKNKFETAVVDEPSVFEPLKFYCISQFDQLCLSVKSNFPDNAPQSIIGVGRGGGGGQGGLDPQ